MSSDPILNHKQVSIYYLGYDQMIDVDAEMAPLLRVLWDKGIMTCNSCQEIEPGIMWIEFYSAEDVEAFVTLLVVALGNSTSQFPEADDWLYLRMFGGIGEERKPWKYEAHPNLCQELLDSDCLKTNISSSGAIALTVSVRFPIDDYNRLLELVSH
jgi:hypothetical protein